ncbi:hypothetical protein FDP41_001284 [Naegleria fowleri]|uniref:Oxidation resistance protein 1 n=1 Tax=Naegleria fowleri TaxID=5763 RepID=A0A6A5BWD1_NAEFO|nr:uncharacterized protein FDP41_001284 [Naegleria fowleri]KAF0979616.1 hypothetical protein FDP41_001284 [Naegleria fowleri]CAG4714800.1 unnamed protein product [Naegleria fowleri]
MSTSAAILPVSEQDGFVVVGQDSSSPIKKNNEDSISSTPIITDNTNTTNIVNSDQSKFQSSSSEEEDTPLPPSPTEPPFIDIIVDRDNVTVAAIALRNNMDIDEFLYANPHYSLLDIIDKGTKVKIKNPKHFEQKQKRDARMREIWKKQEEEERLKELKEPVKNSPEQSSTSQTYSETVIKHHLNPKHLSQSAINIAGDMVDSVGHTVAEGIGSVASGVGTVTKASTNMVGSVASSVGNTALNIAGGVGNVATSVSKTVGSTAMSLAGGVWGWGSSMMGFTSRSRSGSSSTSNALVQGDDLVVNDGTVGNNHELSTQTRKRANSEVGDYISMIPFTGDIIFQGRLPTPTNSPSTSPKVDPHIPTTTTTPSEEFAPPLQLHHHVSNIDLKIQYRTPEIIGATKPVILKESQLRELSLSLPVRFRNKNFLLLYSTQEHGISLQTMYRKIEQREPVILVVQTMKGEIFGAFLTEQVEMTKKERYYGDGQSFVFKFEKQTSNHSKPHSPHPEDDEYVLVHNSHPKHKEQQTICVYNWTRKNEYFQLTSARQFSVGGGGQGFALTLDPDLKYGSSYSSETFGNDPLTSHTDFEIFAVEVFTLESLFSSTPSKTNSAITFKLQQL